MSFEVDLDTFNGPLDLLLYLIRRDEIEIYDIPVSHITTEYMALITDIEQLNIRNAGDFLVMASTLMEIKSNMMLPRVASRRGREDEEDPRRELLRQLLAYRRYKEAAERLDKMEMAQSHRRFHPFDAAEVVPPPTDPSNDYIKADLWDLVAAYGRLLSSLGREQPMELVADDTPIEVYMERIVSCATAQGRVRFAELLEGGNRANLIGLFLALLELMKEYQIQAIQKEAFGEIYLIPGPGHEPELEAASEPQADLPDDDAQLDISP